MSIELLSRPLDGAVIPGNDAITDTPDDSFDSPDQKVGDPSETCKAADIVSTESRRLDVKDWKHDDWISSGIDDTTWQTPEHKARRSDRTTLALRGAHDSFQVSLENGYMRST